MTSLEAVFGADGLLARALPDFKPRPAQQHMAAAISAALSARQSLLIEAGTGTGKTYAYLVPALLSGLRVLISTGTRTLQDQLYHRDLPRLAGALGRPARVALLKGRSNYLCRSRLADVGKQEELLPAAADSTLAEIRAWSRITRGGDWAELTRLAESHPLRAQLSATRERCTGSRCPEYGRCHIFAARRRALEADIVVVNHHLLLADLALKEEGYGDLLPGVDAVIVDEAHQLPDLASEFFGTSLSARQLELLLTDLAAQVRVAETMGLRPLGRMIQAQATAIAAALAQAQRLLVASAGSEERVLDLQELPDAARGALGQLESLLGTLPAQLSELTHELPDLQSCIERAEIQAAALAAITDHGRSGGGDDGDSDSDSDSDRDSDREGGGGADAARRVAGTRTISFVGRGFTLRLLPHDISQRFSAFIKPGQMSWVFTSATLALGEDFGHFAGRLGVQSAAVLRLASPFDYPAQGLLYLPPAMPEPGAPDFIDACLEATLPLIEAAGGGAFLLFTSHRALQASAARLARRLGPALPLLVQGSAPREALLRNFRASGNAVLLGSASFWEGVDVQGPALRLVVIDRLPFASPEDPLVRSRSAYLRAQGVSPFAHYQLPEAVLALKQGVGRLIRSETDQGVVMICDPRLMNRSYGRIFRASLPPMRVTSDLQLACSRLAAVRSAPGDYLREAVGD